LTLKHPIFIQEDMGGKTSTKAAYFDKLKGLLEEYKSIFIVTVDNVSSQQMHEIRQSLRGEGVVLMGKNTMVSVAGFRHAQLRPYTATESVDTPTTWALR
jgi:ribosomal protein L10